MSAPLLATLLVLVAYSIRLSRDLVRLQLRRAVRQARTLRPYSGVLVYGRPYVVASVNVRHTSEETQAEVKLISQQNFLQNYTYMEQE